jgi:hypothetical protein
VRSDDVAILIKHFDVGPFVIPGVDREEVKLEDDLVESLELRSRNSGSKLSASTALSFTSVVSVTSTGSLRPSSASFMRPSGDIRGIRVARYWSS